MRITLVSSILIASLSSAHAISFSLCNKHGVGPVAIAAWDRKAGNAQIFNGTVGKDQCAPANASGGTGGDYADILLKVGGGNPYGVPWVRPGDQVNF